jgi:hypothetical protein
MKDVPASGIEYVVQKLGIEGETRVVYAHATLYRHQAAVLEHLGVTSWGDQARKLAESTMTKVAKARTDPADLINAAVDALVRHRFELPALIALRRLAGTVHSAGLDISRSDIANRRKAVNVAITFGMSPYSRTRISKP